MAENMESKLLAPPKEKYFMQDVLVPAAYNDTNDKNRRGSTINSYTLSNYQSLPKDVGTSRKINEMTYVKAMKNVVVCGFAFMFTYTAFVSLQGLQSTLHSDGGVGVVSLSCIYATTVLSCLFAPWLIDKLTTKWTMIIAFIIFTGYFAGNFYPKHFMLIPLGIILGMLAGPLWSAQATFITTTAITYAEHANIADQDAMINKFMAIFYGFYRTSFIWGNIITAIVLSNNQTKSLNTGYLYANASKKLCGAADCELLSLYTNVYDSPFAQSQFTATLPENTKFVLLSVYLGCGVMGVILLFSLLDTSSSSNKDNMSQSLWTSKELFMSTLHMFKDSRCQLLVPLVIFIGLEQGFMFGDFTKSYVNCTLGVHNIGPVLICFGVVSAVSSIIIGCIAEHIKRFAFITAAATFNVGLLIVLWLWRPLPGDIPNFYVVAACMGLCDAIWQTQTYTLFGVLFMDKQEGAFACYRMLHSTGCALAFGYSYFICVETKVYILAGFLAFSLLMYSVIEMKVQLQSQHIRDIVAL